MSKGHRNGRAHVRGFDASSRETLKAPAAASEQDGRLYVPCDVRATGGEARHKPTR